MGYVIYLIVVVRFRNLVGQSIYLMLGKQDLLVIAKKRRRRELLCRELHLRCVLKERGALLIDESAPQEIRFRVLK